eukprot:CAMPEP_0119470472 /NCGR_PEP_ID=MMETSP1344-20130328/3362_1 /TAXON_ID=236787 /ORGANISM="Florenciella parvula, Strain CCMP2471" /LENGTH=51 /DNA_ID=CAMNT_0007503155 /DNA_START=119 /DNA_END=271 /DNA_ORIENTATION=+
MNRSFTTAAVAPSTSGELPPPSMAAQSTGPWSTGPLLVPSSSIKRRDRSSS